MLHPACLLVCAWLQGAPASPPGSDVVVTGARPAEASRETLARSRGVVDALTRTTRLDGLIVRRFYPPCLKVVGVPPFYAAVLAARLEAAAAFVDLLPAPRRCEPDVLVVFTPDVELFVSRSDLRNWSDQGERFVVAERGRPPFPPRRIATFKTFGERPTTAGGGGSRIKRSVADFYDRTVLLVREDVAYDFTAEALGDHLAMLALTSADETSVSPQPSILNLLARAGRPDAPGGLTRWDRAYLRAYYKAFEDQPDSVVLGQITRQMVKEGVPDSGR